MSETGRDSRAGLLREVSGLLMVIAGVAAAVLALVLIFDWPGALLSGGLALIPIGVVVGSHEPAPTRLRTPTEVGAESTMEVRHRTPEDGQ